MNHTNIEWIVNPNGSRPGWSWNPITGCLNNCSYCYARKLANGRLKSRYLQNDELAWSLHRPAEADDDPFYPRFWEGRLLELRGSGAYDNAYPDRNAYNASREKDKGIFVCDMGDLFGIGVPEKWTKRVLEQCKIHSNHRFYLLTKQPQNLPQFSPFPENAWVGVTATNQTMFNTAYDYLSAIKASIRFISLEPLLSSIDDLSVLELKPKYIDWLIIGACTGTYWEMSQLAERMYEKDSELKFSRMLILPIGKGRYTLQPKIEWVQEIVEAADKAGISVFLKDNLIPLLPKIEPFYKERHWHAGGMWELRQEMPVVK